MYCILVDVWLCAYTYMYGDDTMAWCGLWRLRCRRWCCHLCFFIYSTDICPFRYTLRKCPIYCYLPTTKKVEVIYWQFSIYSIILGRQSHVNRSVTSTASIYLPHVSILNRPYAVLPLQQQTSNTCMQRILLEHIEQHLWQTNDTRSRPMCT